MGIRNSAEQGSWACLGLCPENEEKAGGRKCAPRALGQRLFRLGALWLQPGGMGGVRSWGACH